MDPKTTVATDDGSGRLLEAFKSMTVDELREFLEAFEAMFCERTAP